MGLDRSTWTGIVTSEGMGVASRGRRRDAYGHGRTAVSGEIHPREGSDDTMREVEGYRGDFAVPGAPLFAHLVFLGSVPAGWL